MAERLGLPYCIGYCSVKADQVGMTCGLALELGPHGIRVTASRLTPSRATASTA